MVLEECRAYGSLEETCRVSMIPENVLRPVLEATNMYPSPK